MTLPVTPFNMHRDMVIAGDSHGGINLKAKDVPGTVLAVWLTADMAARLGTACGRSAPPNANPNAAPPASTYTMTDNDNTKIDPISGGTKVKIDGPATPPGGGSLVELVITLDGPAFTAVKNS